MKKMLFVNIGTQITDRRTWSGIPFSLYQELRKYYEIEEYVISLKNKSLFDKFYIGYKRYIKKENCFWNFTKKFAMKASLDLQHRIEEGNYDVVFVIGAACISYIKSKIPIVYFSDAVFSNMVNYYWYGLKEKEIIEYNETQRKALQNADKIILTSKWARNAAIKDYEIDEQKIEVYHLGSNIEVNNVRHIDHSDFNLLFVGADLKRKGIDVALKCVELCNKMDTLHHYVLHIVGGALDLPIKKDELKVYGFINRNIDSEREKLDYLREISDVFILPTRAECAGIVFCEAAAYGTPSISYDTGGVSDYILNGKTGYLLDVDKSAEDFAKKVIFLANHPDTLQEMQKNARELFENDLNWTKLGLSIHNEISSLLEKNSGSEHN